MGMPANMIVHGSTMIDDEEDNVEGMELAPSETSSMAEQDIKYRPGPPTPYSNTNSSSTMHYAQNNGQKVEMMSQNTTPQQIYPGSSV
jgi:hypothetical protein